MTDQIMNDLKRENRRLRREVSALEVMYDSVSDALKQAILVMEERDPTLSETLEALLAARYSEVGHMPSPSESDTAFHALQAVQRLRLDLR